MKIFKDKKLFVVLLALSALLLTMIAVHGCGISSYTGKKLASISIDPVNNTAVAGNVTIAAQTVQQFKATGHYTDKTMTDLSSSVTWSTSDSSVATVSQGLAAAVALSGTCNITATGQGMTAAVNLTVANLPLQAITVSPGTATINKGMTQQFKATGLFSNGTDTIPSQDITSLVSWSSSTTSAATINASGSATGVSAGTTDITAQWNGVTSPAVTVTVSNLALKSIAITASPSTSVQMGNTIQLTAVGTFEDNSSQDMTSQVTWSSANPDLVTVDSSGLVTTVYMGRATVTATAGGITGSIQLTVLNGGHI